MIDYRNHLDALYSRATVNRKFSTVCSCFRWLEAMRVILPNPCKHIKAYPAADNANTLALTDEEANGLIYASARACPRIHLAVVLMLRLGLRVGEVIKIEKSDIKAGRDATTITINGKGHKTRTLPLPSDIKLHLDKLCRDTNKKRIFDLHSSTIFRKVKKLAKEAGITKNISPHSLRATAVSNALEQGANPVDVQYMCGWSSVKMVNRYDKRDKLKNSAVFRINYQLKDKE